MFNISEIHSYRDGGTIGIKCLMAVSWKEVRWLEDRHNREIEICLDGRFGREPKFWFGYPDADGSEPIEDETIVDYIIKKMAEYKERQAYKLDQIIGFREAVRDWKIKNILE
jgi:hypothetical protein